MNDFEGVVIHVLQSIFSLCVLVCREEDIRQRRHDSVDGIIRRTESDDSLVDYGDGGEIEFNEDGSFIGQYTGVSKHERSDKEYHDSSEATSPVNTIYTFA